VVEHQPHARYDEALSPPPPVATVDSNVRTPILHRSDPASAMTRTAAQANQTLWLRLPWRRPRGTMHVKRLPALVRHRPVAGNASVRRRPRSGVDRAEPDPRPGAAVRMAGPASSARTSPARPAVPPCLGVIVLKAVDYSFVRSFACPLG
jgi:hypothetical protein